jgi:hypothetical protein
MTRETKVGVVVAGSFLGLVAAVVALRMGNATDATTDTPTQIAKENSGVSAIDLRTPPGKQQDVVPASYQQAVNLPPVPDGKTPPAAGPSEASKDMLGSIPMPPSIPAPATIPSLPVVARPASTPSPGPGLATSVTLPPSPTKSTPASETANSRIKNVTSPPPAVAAPPESTVVPLPDASIAAKGTKPSPDEDKQQTVKNELKKQLAVSMQTASAPGKQTDAAAPALPAAAPAVPDDQAKETAAPPVPVPVSGKGPPLLAEASKGGQATPVGDLPLPPAPTPIAKDGNLSSPRFPPPPDAAVKGPATDDPAKTPAVPVPDKSAPPPTAVALGPKASDNPLGDGTRPVEPGSELSGPRQPPASNLTSPPVGAPPTANSAPIKVPTAQPRTGSGEARVQSYDTEKHTCKVGEDTFTDLSKSLYGSEKYASALLQFNRENPLVGDNFHDASPRLKPGQQVVVPPVWVLEEARYANPAPVAKASPEPVRPPIAVAPRPAVAPIPAAPASVPAVAAPVPAPAAANNPALKTAAGASPRVYHVRRNGEMLYEIARQALGDGKRWSEIYRLNPDIRPELAIPGGTQLRLPGDARIGS